MRDRLITYEPGQIPEAAQWNLHAEMLKAQNAGVGCFVDSTGTYIAPPSRARTEKKVYVELTSNLDCASGSTPGTATGKRKKLSKSTKTYEDDAAYPDEITVYETQGAFCGVEGEIIEVRNAGTDSGGETIWEVVRGGATSHVVTLSATLEPGGTVEATVGNATINVTDNWLPTGETLTGVVGVAYNFTNNTWYVWVGAC
jgi:hypothetical protein